MKSLHIVRTSLTQSRELCGRCNGANVLVKREDSQTSGTTKWRRCAAILASRGDKETIFVHISSGNSAEAMGLAVQQREDTSKKVVNIIDKNKTPEEIKKRLRSCSIVVELDLSKELITEDRMREIARKATKYEGSEENIVIVERYQLEGGYRSIATEIAEQLLVETQGKTNRPDFIFCPVGSGETMVELAASVHEIWGDNPPKIIGVTVPGNYIAARYFSSQEGVMRHTGRSIADKLTCAYSAFAELAIRVLEHGAKLMVMNDESELRRNYKWLNSIGIPVEPSAAVAFLGAMKYSQTMCAEKKDGLTPDKTVVIINTGKGIFDQKAVDRVWLKRLRTGAIYAGMAALGAILATMAYFGWIAPRQQVHDMFRGKLEAEALMYGKDRTRKDIYMGFLEKEEIAAMCARIPGKKCDPNSHPNNYDLRDFSDRELAFYIEYMRASSFSGFSDTDLAYFVERSRWEREGDGMGVKLAGDIHYAYEHGHFEIRDNKAIWWYQNNDGRWFRYDGHGNQIWEDEELPKDQWDRIIQRALKK